jgi:hypothetical protein
MYTLIKIVACFVGIFVFHCLLCTVYCDIPKNIKEYTYDLMTNPIFREHSTIVMLIALFASLGAYLVNYNDMAIGLLNFAMGIFIILALGIFIMLIPENS